jgi:hypothetical protein
MSEEPKAVVREIDGELVLDDPVGVACILAVAKHNCRKTLENQLDRVRFFVSRVVERGDSTNDVVVTLINVDDTELSASIAETLMPGHDWQSFRDAGAIPFARGLAQREGFQSMLEEIDKEAAQKLSDLKGLAIIVFDHGTVEVFAAEEFHD